MAINIGTLITDSMAIGSSGSSSGYSETRVKYTAASGKTPREQTFNIEGELTSSSITDISDVEEIDIGNTVTSIGVEAFFGCSGLTSVTIPSSVTNIGENAFYGCSGLTSVTIGNNVTYIWGGAFYNCSRLTDVTIPSNVTNIGWGAFYGCEKLTSVTFLGKTLEQVQNIQDDEGNTYYPWGIENTSIINVA